MPGFKPYRRTAATAVVAGVAVAAMALTSPAQAGTPATDTTAGTASATATSYKVNPTTASLSIGITFGMSLAGYTNKVAQAESRAIDLGIIGTTLGGAGCDGGDPTLPKEDQPQPLRVDSRDGVSGERSETEKFAPVITKTVRADATPYSEARTTTGGLSGAGALVTIDGAQSRAVTQVVKGTRQALATVDISSVKIAGVLELAGLHWEANAKTGTEEGNVGTFTIGSLKVLGQTLPTADALKALENANALLGRVGVLLTMPRSHVEAGILFVDPLAVRIVPSTTRDTITGTILSGAQPIREQLYAALLEQDCGNATYITVSDIAIGSVTGAGSLSLELGGVNAKSEELKTTSFLGGVAPISGNSGGGDTLGGFDAFDSNGTLGALPSTSSRPAGSPGTLARGQRLHASADAGSERTRISGRQDGARRATRPGGDVDLRRKGPSPHAACPASNYGGLKPDGNDVRVPRGSFQINQRLMRGYGPLAVLAAMLIIMALLVPSKPTKVVQTTAGNDDPVSEPLTTTPATPATPPTRPVPPPSAARRSPAAAARCRRAASPSRRRPSCRARAKYRATRTRRSPSSSAAATAAPRTAA